MSCTSTLTAGDWMGAPKLLMAIAVKAFDPAGTLLAMTLNGAVEKILRELGFTLTPVPEGNLCCGSAGTYSLLQPALSQRLRTRKLAALVSGRPEIIVTANIGCLAHLQGGAAVPMRHWIELLGP